MDIWPESEFADGWRHACELRQSLLAGNPVPLLPPPTVRLFPGEVLHGDAILRHEVWYGMNVSYTHSVTAFGGPLMFTAGLLVSAVNNSRRKRQAAQMAAEQWRFHGNNRTMLTSHRLLAFAGDRWVPWNYRSVMELWPAPDYFSLILVFNGIDPLRLTGPGAPWFSVALAYMLYGPAFLAQRPEFQGMGPLPLAMIEQGRQRGTDGARESQRAE